MKKLPKIIIVLAITALVFSSTQIVVAASLSQLQQQQAAAAAAAKAAKDAAARKSAEATYISQEINKLNGEISDTQKAVAATQGQINSTQQTIDDLATKIQDQEIKLAKEKTKLNEIISSWYMEGNVGFFETLFSSDSLSAMVSKQQYYDSIKRQVTLTMNQISVLKAELAAQKADQEKQMVVLQSLKADQTSQQKSLENSQYLKQGLLTNTNNAVANLKQIAADELKKEQDAQGEIRRMEIAAAGGRTGTLSGVSALGFSWPVDGMLGCGYGFSDCYFPDIFHTGIDIRAYSGASISAAKGGTVIDTRDGMGNTYPSVKSYGNFVKIRHEGGVITLYGHLLAGSLSVNVGDTVSKGQIIGQMGNSGYSTGPHLHFEMRQSDDVTTVNPMSYLP